MAQNVATSGAPHVGPMDDPPRKRRPASPREAAKMDILAGVYPVEDDTLPPRRTWRERFARVFKRQTA